MKKHNVFDIFLVLSVIFYNLGVTFISFLWLFTGKYDLTKTSLFGSDPSIFTARTNLVSFFFSGMLGGSFYCLRSVYQRLGEAYNPVQFERSQSHTCPTDVFNIRIWFFWYLYRPIQAGILSVVIICLLNQGFISISSSSPEKIGSLFFQIAVGFLIGFGTHEVINKIEEIIKVTFAKKTQEAQKSVLQKSQEKVLENINKGE